MKLTPFLCLVTVLLCAHVTQAKFVIKVSSILGASGSGSSIADRLKNWLNSRKEDQPADGVAADGTGDDNVDDSGDLLNNVDIEDDVDDDVTDDKEVRKLKWKIWIHKQKARNCKSGLLSALLKKAKTHAQILLRRLKKKKNEDKTEETTTTPEPTTTTTTTTQAPDVSPVF